MKSLVIGLGFGEKYTRMLKTMGHQVYTIDPNPTKSADYTMFEQALESAPWDTAHISTPNYTHYTLARRAAHHGTKIVFVDKPGVETPEQWQSLVEEFPNTRFMMVKNNQYRQGIDELKQKYEHAKDITFIWQNNNRVPSPGSWFCNKTKAFGGVSRDLLPHILSLFTYMDSDYSQYKWNPLIKYQNWQLEDLLDTDYGDVNPKGVYDVDDRVEISSIFKKKYVKFIADWRSLTGDKIGIIIDKEFYPLGLCPEEAYIEMFKTAIANQLNDEYWEKQLSQDLWIIGKIQ